MHPYKFIIFSLVFKHAAGRLLQAASAEGSAHYQLEQPPAQLLPDQPGKLIHHGQIWPMFAPVVLCVSLVCLFTMLFAIWQCSQFGAGLESAIHAARLCFCHVSKQKQSKGLLALEDSHRQWEPYDLQAACGYHSGISTIGSLSAAETVCMVQMTFCCQSRPQHYSPTWTSGLTQICTH